MTGFILTGGKNTRMGMDKAFLELNGRTLLARALDLARAVTQDVRIVGAREKYADYAETVEDIFPGRGPLGGIHAALKSTPSELNLILAVDAPFIRPEFLRYLAEQAEQTKALVTVAENPLQAKTSAPDRPRHRGFRSEFHMLCAVYRRDFGERAEAALRAGQNKIDLLFTPEEARIITAAELERLSFPPSMFENLNTPDEFERAAALEIAREPRGC